DDFSTLTTHKLFVGGQQVRPASNASSRAISHDGRTVGYFPEAGRKDVQKCGGSSACGLQDSTTVKGTVIHVNEPLGVIGIACSEKACLLSNFVSAMAVALAAGNSVVVLASSKWPLPALHFCQVSQHSFVSCRRPDIPPGVVNVLSAKEQPVLLRTLAEHHDVAAVWYYGEQNSTVAFLRSAVSHNDKRCWVFPLRDDQDRDWKGWHISQHATVPKSIWLPFGDTFAN
ncbi:hypothetical protein MTO96_029384, partial [Rhipicephalus appendiculatus]